MATLNIGAPARPARYFVLDPAHDGPKFYSVRDRDFPNQPNFEVASFWHKLPGAAKAARDLCAQLNAK